MDTTMISYEVLRWAVAYNLLLFIVWLIMVRHDGGSTSEIYVIVLTLFAARYFGVLQGIRARTLRGTPDYYEFMDGLWWDFRLAPEAIVYVVLGAILTRRFIKSYVFRDPNFRKTHGRRKSDRE